MTDLPAGYECRQMTLTDCGVPFPWWRVYDGGHLVGSGFDRNEAVEDAWRTYLRRAAA